MVLSRSTLTLIKKRKRRSPDRFGSAATSIRATSKRVRKPNAAASARTSKPVRKSAAAVAHKPARKAETAANASAAKPVRTPKPAKSKAATAALDRCAKHLTAAVVLEHVKLVQTKIEQNIDKYYVLQLLRADEGHFVVNRWGRTGTEGQAKLSGPYSSDDALAELADKFREKTGNEFSQRASFVEKDGLYGLVAGADAGGAGAADVRDGRLWQYYMDDGVDGKVDGWYDYTAAAAEIVEGVYAEWHDNPRLNVRCVQSGYFSYRVDFNTMTQTNVSHPARKQRKIRRNA